MFILKLLLFPFIFIWRLITGIIKFILITEVLIATLSLLALAALAYLFFHGDHGMIQKVTNFFH